MSFLRLAATLGEDDYMDWSTVIASAGVSAVVGTSASYLAVSGITVRQAKAGRRYAASEAISEVVAPILANVVKYQAGMNRIQREEGVYHGGDFVTASAILTASKQLGTVRHWLVVRRCRRLFGAFTTKLADVSPTQGDSLGAFLAPVLAAEYGDGALKEESQNRLSGLMYEALTKECHAREVTTLIRELRRLAACR